MTHDHQEKAIERMVLHEQVALAYRLGPSSVIISLVPIVFLWWLLRPIYPGLRSNGWLAGFLVFAAVRIVIAYFYKRRKATPDAAGFWGLLFSLCMFVTGLLWGYAAIALFPLGHPYLQVLLMITIAGAAAGALPFVMPLRWTYASYVIPITAPLIAYMISLGSIEQIFIGVLTVCFTGFMLFSSVGIRRNVVENISSRFRQTLMAEEIETANWQLRDEIVERKRAEEALRKSEALFRAVVEKSSEVLLLTNVEGEILYVSPPAMESFGYSPADLIGTEARGLVHHEDWHALAKAMVWVRQNPGKPKNTAVRIRHKDGSWRWVDITARNLLSQPGVGAIVSNLRDITDQTNAGEALHWKTTFLEALVASSHDGILVLDSRMQRVTQNERLVEMWKMPRGVAAAEDEEQLINFLMASIENPEELYKTLMHLHNHPDDSVRGEFELKDGAVIEAFSYPVLGKDSTERYGRIWMFRDITELRRYWDMVENLSTTDGLTGISNRRRFDEYLEREWRRSMRRIFRAVASAHRYRLL